MASIDNAMKAKLNNYNLVKGSLTQMQRKKQSVTSEFSVKNLDRRFRGNLSVRSLADVVSKDDFIQDSEYMETLLVAVPRYATTVKLWWFINQSQERLRKIGIRNMSD
jgi:V-type H+-transporting ATPase subunit C